MAAKDDDHDKTDKDDNAHTLDMSQAAVKKMIAEARERGYITYDQLNAVLPPEQVSSEQIEDVMSMLSEMGINVIEDDEAAEESEGGAIVTTGTGSRDLAVSTTETEKLDRTDDPVRMYLREMGSVELLSREGEIAIAKRIEAGRNTMIAGLCESPLTFKAITLWREELLDEEILLRDVIDLETTFGQAMDGEEAEEVELTVEGEAGTTAPKREEFDADGNPLRVEEDDEEDEGANLSLAAMEASLKPKVLETLEAIAHHYEGLADMQDQRMSATLNEDNSFSASAETDYQTLRSEIVVLVNSLHLNSGRIEALVDQLYGINRRIVTIDSGMVKLATPPASTAVNSSTPIAALSWTRPGSTACRRRPGAAGRRCSTARAMRSKSCAATWPRSASMWASTSRNSAGSSLRSSAARKRPVRPRRRWSRPTCAWSSRLQKNTRTVACNSLILFRKAISA